MKIDWSRVRIFIQTGPTDMRKQINGLAVLAEEAMNQDSLSGNLFIFCNRPRNRLKVLYWDRNGFCLWFKRLEQDKFPWPMNTEECREITDEELFMLLDGINFFNAHKKLNFSSAS
jgi:transposase